MKREFIVYPAIDLKDGKCVRLLQGNYDKQTTYNNDPIAVALEWERLGGRFLHIVDLDGAKDGVGSNAAIIKEIAATVNIPVQTGGGIRSLEVIESMLNSGVARVIIGTAAITDRDFLKSAILKYGDNIAVGIDAKDGYAAIEGWTTVSERSAVEFAKDLEQLGVKCIIYTDIATDGMLTGPNITAMREMTSNTNMQVIASGGVSCADDVSALRNTDVSGVIIGQALYTGAVKLNEIV